VDIDVGEDGRRDVPHKRCVRFQAAQVAASNPTHGGLTDGCDVGDGAGRPPLSTGRRFVECACQNATDDFIGSWGAPGVRDVVQAVDAGVDVPPPPFGHRRPAYRRPSGSLGDAEVRTVDNEPRARRHAVRTLPRSSGAQEHLAVVGGEPVVLISHIRDATLF
jgi:hypothetical protein